MSMFIITVNLKALASIKKLEKNQENSSSTVMVAFCLRVVA